ncbi:MAG TPA: GNAT family N-acetyltransferase [Verrucomicrobiota bacterium]|nr:N-acetyltransferase [Verrucomicrobiales bacterium]HRI15606.1 GNAT family N-acetyltransferase [Verrucomicrobiota bacterium]
MSDASRKPGLAPGFSIRPAVAGDVPVIFRFIQALAEYERLAHEVTATEATLQATLFGAQPSAEVLLAEFDGAPVGFALFFSNYSTFLAKPGLYLEDLFVLPEFRGRGFGKALLVAGARLAAERGCGRYEWAVLDWNTPSIQFYESLGARPMSDWTIMRVSGDSLEKLASERVRADLTDSRAIGA